MNTKKIILISLILMLLLVPISFAADGDYTIPSAIKDITVNDDGSTFITEKITYDVEGSINGVYRDIPHSSDQTVTNISVETPGYYNTVEVIESNGKTRIKVWLYTDEEKQQKTYNAKVEVSYSYVFNNGVKIYNDVAELQYMTWGKEWDSAVEYLESNIHIPGSKDKAEYWNNPDVYVVSSEWTSDNTLTTISKGLSSHTTYEQRILMPKSYFKSYDNAQVIDMDAKSKIESDQKIHERNRNYLNTLISLSTGILAIFMIIPMGIYAFFGREPKINYKAEYEYDLPTNATPIQVNSIVVGDVNKIDDNGFYATILDLINRKYFKVIHSDEDDTVIRQTDKDTSDLKEYEQSLLSYLSKFAVNSDISLKSIGKTEKPSEYKKFKNNWIQLAKKEVPDSLIKGLFIKRGHRFFRAFAVIFLIISNVLFFLAASVDLKLNHFLILMLMVVVIYIESTLMFAMPNTFAGHWTPQGKQFHDKWKNFEKYITDFSLIKEHPPASVDIWGKYLVYAAALGCADKVSENMRKYLDLNDLSQDYINHSDVLYFSYFGGLNHMNSSFSSLHKSSSSGGIGGVGSGGFGGGGGGTF